MCDVRIDSRISAALNWIEFDTVEMRRMNYVVPQSTFHVGIVAKSEPLMALEKNVWGLSSMKYNYKVKVINYTLNFYRDGHVNNVAHSF